MSPVLRWLALCGLLCSALPVMAQQATFHVATNGNNSNPGTAAQPFATLDRAQTAVRAINGSMTGDIVVQVHGGRYQLSAPLSLATADSGTNGHYVIWQSAPGEIARLSGGSVVTGWVQDSASLWHAPLGGRYARQIYVNGVRSSVAQQPNSWPDISTWRVLDVDDGSNRIKVWSSTLSGVSNGTEILVNGSFWQDATFVTGTSDVGDGTTWVSLRDPLRSFGHANGKPFKVLNRQAFLDTAGELWIDQGASILYYRPRAGETMTSATVIIPQLGTLLQVTGSSGAPVHHLQFRNLRFEHNNFTDIEVTGAYAIFGSGYGIYSGGSGNPTPAVRLRYVTNLVFDRNVIRHMGGSGLWADGVQQSTFTGNVLTDIGGFGLLFYPVDGGSGAAEQNRQLTVDNNYFKGIGKDYAAMEAIDDFSADVISYQHNVFDDVGMGALSVTDYFEQFGSGPDKTQTLINYNQFHNLMHSTCDYGAIYMYGNIPSSTINFNDFNHVRGLCGDGPAIYCDDGYDPNQLCTGWTIRNNAYRDLDISLYLHKAHSITVYNAGTPQDPAYGQIWDYRDAPDFPANVYINDGTFNESAVVAGSGLESSYSDILARATEDVGAGGGGLPAPTNLRLISITP